MAYSMLLDQAMLARPGMPLPRVQKELDDGLAGIARKIRAAEFAPLALVVEATQGPGRKKVKKSDLLAAEWGLSGTVYHDGGP